MMTLTLTNGFGGNPGMDHRHTVSEKTVATASRMLGGDVNLHARADGAERRWAVELQRILEARLEESPAVMLRAWQAACLEGLGSGRWEPMVDVGDAAIRIGRMTGLNFAFSMKARQAYSVALYRAQYQGAVDGVARAAAGFTALGDREAVDQCARIAERLGREIGPRTP